ncbi:cobalamin B12-binding domain-containing protein [Candidatus Woesearchaeota archaeon]|nr:cobalamin B12-binding domain-containing protein [Candidatus Woesearchaeota archaeon]
MRVLLVNPPATNTFEEHDEPNHPCMSVAYIASYLRSKGILVDVLDCKLEKLNFENSVQRFRENKYDIVGFTSFTHDVHNVNILCEAFKKIDPNIVTALGGVHVTALPYDTLMAFEKLDIAVIGEGEYTFYELCDAIENRNKDFSKVFGIFYKDDKNEIHINPIRMREQNLDNLPFPAYDLFPKAKKYQVITARGCPNFCSFCMSPYGRKIMRFRGLENVMQELDWIINVFHPIEIRFNDETFSHDYDRATKMVNMIMEAGYHKKTSFRASTRANKIDYDLAVLMKRANFCYLEIGVETGDQDIMIKTHKGTTVDQVASAVRIAKKAGLTVGCGFIIGHPYETKATAKKTMDLMVELNPSVGAVGIMVPYPGTEVYELARQGKAGYKLLSADWRDYNKQIGNALEMESLNRKEMERLQAYGYLKLYVKNYRFLDLAKFVWKYRKAGIYFVKKQFGIKTDYNKMKDAQKEKLEKTVASVIASSG